MKSQLHPAVEAALHGLWTIQQAAADLNADTAINRKSDVVADDVRAILELHAGILEQLEGSLRMYLLHKTVDALHAKWQAAQVVAPCLTINASSPKRGA